MSQILRVATRFIPNCEEWFWDGLNGSFVEGIKYYFNNSISFLLPLERVFSIKNPYLTGRILGYVQKIVLLTIKSPQTINHQLNINENNTTNFIALSSSLLWTGSSENLFL
jgi:hypothetical protein